MYIFIYICICMYITLILSYNIYAPANQAEPSGSSHQAGLPPASLAHLFKEKNYCQRQD